MNMGKKTPLYECHIHAKARFVTFSGWDMPLHYGSQMDEHHTVRQDAGVFDVSHMTIVDCTGSEAHDFLSVLLANDVGRLTPGKGLYTCMLNEKGGVVDDLIVYQLSGHSYRLVVNAATHDKDLAWMGEQAKLFKVTLAERSDLAMLAIQGPKVKEKILRVFSVSETTSFLQLAPFHSIQVNNIFVARTGYTGEEGFEMMVPASEAPSLWRRLIAADIHPCGLGARDTLRLEAGLNLYGSDMDEKVTPLESNLSWTVAFDPVSRNFIGRRALEKQKASGVVRYLTGLILEGPGVPRSHQKVFIEAVEAGTITSGSFSPALNTGIALARVPRSIPEYCSVEIRGKQVRARVVKPPFLRYSQKNL